MISLPPPSTELNDQIHPKYPDHLAIIIKLLNHETHNNHPPYTLSRNSSTYQRWIYNIAPHTSSHEPNFSSLNNSLSIRHNTSSLHVIPVTYPLILTYSTNPTDDAPNTNTVSRLIPFAITDPIMPIQKLLLESIIHHSFPHKVDVSTIRHHRPSIYITFTMVY